MPEERLDELIATIIAQLRASAPLGELVARRLVINLDRISDYREFDRRRELDVTAAAFIARHEQGLRIRHQLGTSGLPSGVDRALIWDAIAQGRDVELAEAIWNAGMQIIPEVGVQEVGGSVATLRELQGEWGDPGAKRIA